MKSFNVDKKLRTAYIRIKFTARKWYSTSFNARRWTVEIFIILPISVPFHSTALQLQMKKNVWNDWSWFVSNTSVTNIWQGYNENNSEYTNPILLNPINNILEVSIFSIIHQHVLKFGGHLLSQLRCMKLITVYYSM